MKDIQILAAWMTPVSGKEQFLCNIKADFVFSHLPVSGIHELFPFFKIKMMTKRLPKHSHVQSSIISIWNSTGWSANLRGSPLAGEKQRCFLCNPISFQPEFWLNPGDFQQHPPVWAKGRSALPGRRWFFANDQDDNNGTGDAHLLTGGPVFHASVPAFPAPRNLKSAGLCLKLCSFLLTQDLIMGFGVFFLHFPHTETLVFPIDFCFCLCWKQLPLLFPEGKNKYNNKYK